MDFHLRNLRTGTVHSLAPSGTLVGSADHAAVRTAEGGPFLAALVARYPAGWAVHGLSDDRGVAVGARPLAVGGQATPRAGDLLAVGEDRFRFLGSEGPGGGAVAAARPPALFVYLRDPDGMEECRVVDHDLLIGRLPVCHVRFPDSRLSRLTALLAAHGGGWYVHCLSRSPVVARNRRLVSGYEPLGDGDELLVGPLAVRVEFGGAVPPEPAAPAGAAHRSRDTDDPDALSTAEPSEPSPAPVQAVRAAGVRLDQWLRGQRPARSAEGGVGGWLGAQRDRLSRFWFDTPEATAARGLRAAGRVEEAFAVLERAIRSRPDSPALLRELYRLYDAVGLIDLCFRPLRQIEKLAAARGTADPWVLEALARLCERLGRDNPGMYDRAIRYWDRLEAATGVSYARERVAALANRALRDSGFAGGADDDGD